MLRGKPFRPTEETLHGTNRTLRLAGSSSRRSGSGWRTANAIGAVVGGLRSYSLLNAETLVLVNHTVRLSGLTLSQGKGGPAGRALRSEAIAAPLFYISKDTHHLIESCCSED